jgi:cell division protein FtsB
MRRLCAALAVAGALFPFAAMCAAEPVTRVAQMARDVTDAVRKQRNEQRERSRADEHTRRGSKR